MEKIIHNDMVINIPTSWAELTILQLYNLTDYTKSIGEQEIEDKIIYANFFHHITNLSKNVFFKLPVVDAIKFQNAMQFITATKIQEEAFKGEIIFDKYVLKFKNFDNLNYGEFLDASSFSIDPSGKNLIKLLSLLSDVYIKKDIKKLRFNDRLLINVTEEQREDIISGLPATKAQAVVSFFLHGQKQLGRNTAYFLNRLALRLAMKAILLGVGITISGLWMRVKKMLPNLMKWFRNRSDKSSHTLPTEHQKII